MELKQVPHAIESVFLDIKNSVKLRLTMKKDAYAKKIHPRSLQLYETFSCLAYFLNRKAAAHYLIKLIKRADC